MPRLDDARQERETLIDVICHSPAVGWEWQPFVRAELEHMPAWFPWVVVYQVTPDVSGSWGFLRHPTDSTILRKRAEAEARLGRRLGPHRKVNVSRLLRGHVEVAAFEAITTDDPDRWPLV